MNTTNDLIKKVVSRRTFLAGAGTASAVTLLAGCGGSPTLKPPSPRPAGITDLDVLNFALNLEYLEAEFYLRAATGSGLIAADAGSGAGAVTGGSAVPGLSATFQSYINELAHDEQQHVRFLRSVLGKSAVARPVIDFQASFSTLATAAGITGGFNPFANFDSFLVGAFIFEDVGVTAYHSTASLFSTTSTGKTYLTAAAGILGDEAYHAAAIRTLLTGRAVTAKAAGTAYPYLGLANQVSALRGKLGGGNETTLTLPTSFTKPSTIAAADTTNAIAFSRTTDQVLHVVYGTGGGAGIKSGAFFPKGLNGKITVTTA